MRRLVTIAFLFPLLAFGQPYGNEWLNFDQDYFKIMVPANGIYQVGYDDLQAAGFPLSGMDPGLLQMFRRGREVAIHVEDQGDGSFDQDDYLLFYGQKNDGQLDAELYVAPEAQPHQYLSLYADSAAYFLTLGPGPGQRMDTLPAFTGPPPDTWVEREIIAALQTDYAPGITDGESTQLSQFDYGEGFTGPRAIEVSRPNRDIDLTGIDYPNLAGPVPEIELVVVGRNPEDHQFEVLVGPDANNLISIGSFNFTGFNHQVIKSNIAWNSISASGNLKIRVSVIANGGNRSSISISSAKLNYARLPDLNNGVYIESKTEAKLSGGNTLVFSNTIPEAGAFDISDPWNPKIIVDTDVDQNTISLGFSNATVSRKIAVAVPDTLFSIRKASLRAINPAEHDYLIISHDSIMKPAGAYTNMDVVTAYASYRASLDGGGFDTLIANIDMLYNQFSYGQPTPVAIFRFMRYMITNGDPKHLFIIGKGLDVSLKYHKTSNWTRSRRDYVPTGGSPGSDLVYTVGYGDNPRAYSVPVGRLGVIQPIEVANYLDKVREMEVLPYDVLWRKNLLHLSGGNDLSEIKEFRDYVDRYANQASGFYLGGRSTTKSKQTTNSVEFIDVASEVNNGVNIITFFGHSSPNTVDIDIGFVTDPTMGYDNKGKYPLILMNGCNTGNIYENNRLFSEDWVHAADKGATGVIAHSSYGDPPLLNLWSTYFYQFAYEDSTFINKSIGEIMVETARLVMSQSGTTPIFVKFFTTQVQQMGLQGDPAVKLFGTAIPDYALKESNVEFLSFNGGNVTAEEDSFGIVIGVPNYGAYIDDSLEVAVHRTLPDLSVITLDTLVFPPVAYLDTLQLVINNKDINAPGINRFDITLDPSNKIIEHEDELNNQISISLNIKTAGTVNTLPYNYRLQSEDTIDLLVQPGDILQPKRAYSIVLDTAADFSSPYLQSFQRDSSSLITVSDLALLNSDTTTYYWRSKYTNPGENESAEWTTSSFSVIQGASQGWAQLAYPQHIENSLVGLEANEVAQQIDFLKSKITVEMRVPGIGADTIYYQPPSAIVRDAQLTINGVNYLYFVNRFQPFTYCYYNRLNIVAIDKESSVPYAPIFGNQVNQWTCGLAPEIINSFPNGNRVSLDSIINAINPGDKVLIFNVGSFDFNTLDPATIGNLEDLGADASVLLAKDPGAPYILVGTKGAGATNSIAELVADPGSGVSPNEQTLFYSGELTGNYSHGSLVTQEIGPANNWQTLSLKLKTPDSADNYSLDIYGYTLEGDESILREDITSPVTDISFIDASTYPYLKLRLDLEDTVTLSAPQLDNWIVTYEPSAEGYLSFDSLNLSTARQIELNEGEELRVRLSFSNISDLPFTSDSLFVQYTSFNQLTRQIDSAAHMIKAPLPGDSTGIYLDIITKGKGGLNNLSVFVNPMLEVEQGYSNNEISLQDYLNVIADDTNPVLDVSFDGQYIFDGDIVSPNPNISIIIRDENPYLLKADTAGVSILLKRPCEGCSFERIALGGSNIVWTPEDDKNPFSIEFTPKQLENGVYELQVQVEDEAGNLSGTEPYKISFEVINESTVTNFYPYPNPFSTSVKFIFTLTGNELPDELMIRIMTVSGRVVKEIRQDELGLLRIGNNVTDYAWDGRDEFGDQLANGVYLYKVYMRQNGQNVELRPSAGDRGFKNGYGKLYLLR